MTKKHLQFCIYYMQVGDPQVAYKMTYPRAAVKSLKASVSRLMARPDVAEWVNGTEERVHNRMMRKFYSEHYDEFKEKLLTINEKRTVLTKIIKGETKRVRYIKGKYGLDRVEEDLPVYAVLRAVDLDTRLENFYNYLTRSDTWRKAQNIYVNTPTLQQQVNILISQTNEKEEGKDVVQEHVLSPAACPDNLGSGCDPARAGTRVEHSRGADNTSPLSGDLGVHPRQTLAPDTPDPETCLPFRGIGGEPAPDTHEEQNTSPLSGDLGVHPRQTLAPDTPDPETCLPFRGIGGEPAPDTHEEQNTSPLSGDLGVSSRGTDHTKKNTPFFNNS